MSPATATQTSETACPILKPLAPPLARPIRVDRHVCLVGSHYHVHLPLHSNGISRTHAVIVVDGAESYIRDLASLNGLCINGVAVRERKLRHGDLLCIGP